MVAQGKGGKIIGACSTAGYRPVRAYEGNVKLDSGCSADTDVTFSRRSGSRILPASGRFED